MSAAGNQLIRPIMGGIQIASALDFGTLGLVRKTGFFLTAGHVVGEVGSFVGQPDYPDTIGQVTANYYLSDNVDIAEIEVPANIAAAVTTVWTDQKATDQVTFVANELPQEGEIVWLQGAFSGNISCSVYLTDVDVNNPVSGRKPLNNVVLLNLDTPSQNGDSGSPVIGKGNNLCYGVYGGKVIFNGVAYGYFTPFDSIEWAENKLPLSKFR